ncbi:right-handed parallel beta-helix repeat-containing protein [uncultured Sphingomonas sp.]|uniref:right-handed parallel beta-helix repeat-containing protein n=1 Tax=uncultured Sphingomonas sp. TaxID=158754 RepID=UPI0035C9E3C1
MKRRTVLAAVAVVPAVVSAAWALRAAAGEDVAGERASVPDFRRAGDRDDSEAFRRAVATGRTVHLPAGKGRGRGGRYLIANGPEHRLAPGVRVVGDGIDRTIVAKSYATAAPFVLFFDSGSADPARNGRSFSFRDLTFEDEVTEQGFSEFSYLVMLNGVTDVRFDRVGFRGFRGDGLHLGSGLVLGQERHNVNVTVADCVFDGVNSNNRNAVSVIDCDGLVIERSRFLNCSRPGDGTINKGDPFNPATGLQMPGPIDFEPNDDGFAIIRNVTIRGNLFRGGGGFAVCLNLRENTKVRAAQRDFTVTDNVIEDRHGGWLTYGYGGDRAITSTRGYAATFSGNTVRRCRTPFVLNGMRGIALTGNVISDCDQHAEIGNLAWNAVVTLSKNRFTRVGLRPIGYALWVRECDRLTLDGNEFVDCGLADRRFGIALAFVSGRMTRLTMRDSRFASPAGRMTQAVVAFKDATIDAKTAVIGPQRMEIAAPPVRVSLRVASP